MDENASQSLLMVGGILLAISVLSFFVYAIATFGGFASNMNAQIEGSEIQKYNQHFLQYEARYNITFQDVISTINFAKDWNNQNDYSFDQVTHNSVEYATNVSIVNSEGKTIDAFGGLIDSDTYKDDKKVKNVLNKLLEDPKYSDYYYAVNIKTISASKEDNKNYYVLNGQFGAANGARSNDIDINKKTGFIQKIYFTAVNKKNYPTLQDKYTIIDAKGKNAEVSYIVKNKDYFKMTEIED